MQHKEARFVILNVNGVGYKVFSTGQTIDELKLEAKESIWTYLAVRENALDLYGFKERETLAFFELLITISGIGPKTALGVLNVASVKTLKQGISSGDISYLTKVSGIGKKIAEKIILELRDKFEAEDHSGTVVGLKGESDAIEALKSLGYAEREARDVLKKVAKEAEDSKGKNGEEKELTAGEKVKRALKILSNEHNNK